MRQFSHHLISRWRQQISPKIVPLLSTVWAIGLGIAALSLWAFAQIADEVMEQETLNFDRNILLTLRTLHRPWLDRLAILITDLGDPWTLGISSGILALLLLWRRRIAEAIVLAIATTGAIGLNVLLKAFFDRPRPELWDRLVNVRYHSFPSGHAMVSLVVLGIIGYWLAVQYPKRRSLILAVTGLWIFATGLSRLYLGVHWPTDVIAGYAAGLVWLIACILSLEIAWKRRSHHAIHSSHSSR
ncbi:phosphatase PAP2 family protein [Microcoleus sp. FACHB-1515]|uniref:phosphatase PAP2 family protein n=1 Tax=Cyanophyceae TaxID=3028117 RepID=UPI001F554C07|nr:phosphatase PAP2 family protein [Microcoleus sp. FACHB-1515]